MEDPENLSMFYYNETLGTFIPINSTVDVSTHTVRGVTDHFSTFAIFYVPTWNALFDAAMQLGRTNSSNSMTYVDVMFTMDSSGSMSNNDPHNYRKTAAKNFVGSLLPEDRAGVVDFDSSAKLLRALTSDFAAVNSSINSLDADGGTNIGAGMSKAISHLRSSGDPEHAWIIILLTDGVGSYSSSYTQQAIDSNITVYTAGLGSGVNSGLLTNIANSTGGQYFPVSSADELPEVFRMISDELESEDTDEDGLPDIVETSGFRDGHGNWYYTDPYNNDTDCDGLTDGEEAGVLTDVDGKIYFNVISNASSVDTDGDHLSDYEEVRGTTIYVADSYDSAVDFLYALHEGTDPTPYLSSIHVTSDPQKRNSDSEGIDDYTEIAMGTDPGNADTDGDHIKDKLEALYGEDPAVFEITSPVLTYEGKVWKDSFSATTKYYFHYTASDLAGVKDLSLLKNGVSRDSYTYTEGKYEVSEDTYFETDWETFLDALRGSQVTIEAADWNENSNEKLAYHRPSQYGVWAAQLGSETIMSEEIASDLGMLSGSSIVLAEAPSTAVELCNYPVGYLDEMKSLAGTIIDDPVLLGQIVTSLPGVIKEQQELENPYDEDDPLHDEFAEGWYSPAT